MAKRKLCFDDDFPRVRKIFQREHEMRMVLDENYRKSIIDRTTSMMFKASSRPDTIETRVEEMEEDLPWPSPSKYKKIPMLFKPVECLEKSKQVSCKMVGDSEDTLSSVAEDTLNDNIDHAEPSTSNGRRCMEKDEDISVASGVSAWSPPDGHRRLYQPNLYSFFPTASVKSDEGQSMPAQENKN